jgi:hypothetical protein
MQLGFLSISRLVGFFLLTPNVTLSRLLYIFVTTNVILLASCFVYTQSCLAAHGDRVLGRKPLVKRSLSCACCRYSSVHVAIEWSRV